MLSYKDIAVYSSYVEGIIAAGNYGASLNWQTFFFYRSAYLVELQMSAQSWQTAFGWHDDNTQCYIKLDIPVTPGAYIVGSGLKQPSWIVNTTNFINANLNRYVPGNDNLRIGGDCSLSVANAKQLTVRCYFDLFYVIPKYL